MSERLKRKPFPSWREHLVPIVKVSKRHYESEFGPREGEGAFACRTWDLRCVADFIWSDTNRLFSRVTAHTTPYDGSTNKFFERLYSWQPSHKQKAVPQVATELYDQLTAARNEQCRDPRCPRHNAYMRHPEWIPQIYEELPEDNPTDVVWRRFCLRPDGMFCENLRKIEERNLSNIEAIRYGGKAEYSLLFPPSKVPYNEEAQKTFFRLLKHNAHRRCPQLDANEQLNLDLSTSKREQSRLLPLDLDPRLRKRVAQRNYTPALWGLYTAPELVRQPEIGRTPELDTTLSKSTSMIAFVAPRTHARTLIVKDSMKDQ